MRVIAGKVKGHKLAAPKGMNVRPTADRIKEAVFSIITPYIYDSEFLDLFSGSGAMGIEALSRGAKRAVFVDSSYESIKCIEKNLEHTRLSAQSILMTDNVLGALNKLNGKGFDIIFLDPPYDKNLVEPVLNSICKNKVLSADGIVVVEYSSRDTVVSLPFYELLKLKDYNFTQIAVYRVTDIGE